MENSSEKNPIQSSLDPNIEYAGFWIRVLASVLDSLLLLMIVIPLLLIFYGPGILFATESPGLVYDFINYGLPLIVIVVFWQYRSATPGKIMMGIYIVDEKTLQNPPFGRLLLRYLGYYVSIIPLLLGLIWVGIDKRKQGFHDKIAGTLVIKKGSAPAESRVEDEVTRNTVDAAPVTAEKHNPWME